MKRSPLFLSLIAVVAIAGMVVLSFPCGAFPAGNARAKASGGPGEDYATGEVLVRFKGFAGAGAAETVKSAAGAVCSRRIGSTGTELLGIGGKSVEEALRVLRSSSLVECAEPNYYRSADDFPVPPDDTDYTDQWNFNDPVNDSDINMEGAWNIEQGDTGTIVAVIDTGVAYRDGGGYQRAPDLDNTFFYKGYDFVNDDPYPDDDDGHGTHVCGTVAQSTNNAYGVAGVAPGCRVMPVKVLDEEGKGTDAEIIEGIEYAADNGADVINMSLSGEDSNELLEDACDYAFSKGVVVCASSGNENNDEVGYPAAYPSCIAVGATRRDRKRASYSNYGTSLDVVAPGGDGPVYGNNIIQESYQTFGDPSSGFTLVAMNGTSMACPHVAGVAALVDSEHPDWSAADVRGAVSSTCRDLGDPGWDREYGWGLVDAEAALKAPRPSSSTPVVSAVVPGFGTEDGTVDVAVTGDRFDDVRLKLEREGEGSIHGTEVSVVSSRKLSGTFDLSGAQPGLWNVAVENSAMYEGVLEGGFEVDPASNTTWYLAEGTTGYGFEEFILIQNPNEEQAAAEITLMTPDGALDPYPISVPGDSRVTVRANDIIQDTDVSARVEADRDIICERSMYWNGRIEGTDSIGVQAPSHTWLLAEGTTSYGFETYLLIQNPSPAPAVVQVRYLTPEGPVVRDPLVLTGNSRYTINVNEELPDSDVSFEVTSDRRVIAERSMYWDGRRGGHVSIGTTLPAGSWYLAEGSTDWGYDEYVLLENPGEDEVDVDITYMTPQGPVPRDTLTLAAGSRRTVHVNDELPGKDVSVRAEAGGGIVVERAMYWNNGTGKGGHCSIGVTQPRQQCYLAEGSTDWGFDEWILVQNPNDTEANIGIEYMTSSGLMGRPGFVLPANSRVTVHVNSELPAIDTSAYVFSNMPVIAERSMYWNANGAGHVSTGLMK